MFVFTYNQAGFCCLISKRGFFRNPYVVPVVRAVCLYELVTLEILVPVAVVTPEVVE